MDKTVKLTAFKLCGRFYLHTVGFYWEPQGQRYGWKTEKEARQWAENHGFEYVENPRLSACLEG